MSLWIKETFVNATEGHLFGESDVYESFADTPGELYRSCLKEYGRCTGKVYVDLPGKPATPVGWVFEGRQKYEDTGESYLREVWVSIHDKPDTVTRESHYFAGMAS
jgi:hypothetical protein